MKILAPFDQSRTSQSTIPLLRQLASLSREVEITLVSVAQVPLAAQLRRTIRDGVTIVSYTQVLPVPLPDVARWTAESEEQSAERMLARLDDYLLNIAGTLPSGVHVNIEAYVSDRPRMVIIESARRRHVDVIVMATRSRGRRSRLLFGSTTEAVVDSGVAPALIVHPHDRVIEPNDAQLHLTRRERLARESI
jgi:nucleotide-binding universal stress UspA family protein